jgi:hypothetical protein
MRLRLGYPRTYRIWGRSAQVVELRCGPTDDEVGKTRGISLAPVKRDWDFARSWLLSQMK